MITNFPSLACIALRFVEPPALTSFNLAILVLFLGKFLNQRVAFFQKYYILESVSSGLLGCGFFVDIPHSITVRILPS